MILWVVGDFHTSNTSNAGEAGVDRGYITILYDIYCLML
jgi:hypothetical protein